MVQGVSASTALTLRVVSITWLSESIRSYELRQPDGGDLPAFSAGAHVTLRLAGGLSRSYSLLNPPHERHRYVLGIARDRASRGGSRFIHDQVCVGDLLQVEAPLNQFELDESAPFTILVGGGIGVTPMVGMAARLDGIGARWQMHYAVRSRAEAAFVGHLSIFDSRAQLHVDDEAGVLLDLDTIVRGAPPLTHFYCCGPAPMLAAFELATSGVEPHRVHVERFAPAEAAATEGGFTVQLARSGRSVFVQAGTTILGALQQAGLPVPSSCLQGVCGVCETNIVSGRPDHRDAVLSPAERAANRSMMICCSGSLDPCLVLDL